jgi:hypothetical protein
LNRANNAGSTCSRNAAVSNASMTGGAVPGAAWLRTRIRTQACAKASRRLCSVQNATCAVICACHAPGQARETAGQRASQPAIRHLVRSQYGDALIAKRQPAEFVAIGVAGSDTREPQQRGRGQQARRAQPRPRALRLDDMPHDRKARGKPRRPVAHPMPSTSIIE